ncbi:MAG: tetratricopeptide repeat protein [Acidobacteria bacterium]|nr:tetratricopeptide repeat protein [Acidobacteriota bacterium]
MAAVQLMLLCTPAAQDAAFEPVQNLLNSGRYQDALDHLEKLSSNEKSAARWHILASKAHDGRNDPVRAVEEAEAALSLEPATEAHHHQLAQIFLTRNTPQAALEIYSDAARLFPASWMIRLGRGLALKELQRWEEAEAALRSCLDEQPRSALAFDALATVYLHRNGFEPVRAAAEKFIKTNTADYRGYYFLAAARDGLGEPSAATRQLIQQALARRPDFAAAHALLGKVLLKEEQFELAAAAFEQAIRHRPDLVQAHLQRATALRRLHRDQEAAVHLDTVKRLKDQEQQGRAVLLYRRGAKP